MMSITKKFYPLKTAGKILIQLCVFFYLYSVQLIFIPFGTGTRVVMGMMGLIIFIFSIEKEVMLQKDIYVQPGFLKYFFALSAIIFSAFLSLLVNQTRDFEFITYPVSIVLILAASYFIHYLIRRVHKQINYELVMKYIVIAVLLQVIISMISYLSPAFSNLLMHLQNLNSLDASKIEETGEHRFIGFGSTFFGAGLMNGFTLMVVAVLLKRKRHTRLKVFLYTVVFFLIFLLGIMMARTTLIGFCFAFLYLFLPSRRINKTNARTKWLFLMYLLIIPVASIGLIFILSPDLITQLIAVINFSFELFINYSQSGTFSTQSTNVLASMYVFPKTLKTYIIGDGQYYIIPGDRSSAYYMHTDVGYLRLVYYFGIIGSFFYFLLQYYVIRNAYKRNIEHKNLKSFFILCFIFCLTLSSKAFTDLFFLIILFCFPYKKEQPVSNGFVHSFSLI